jgi:hypothetical protein
MSLLSRFKIGFFASSLLCAVLASAPVAAAKPVKATDKSDLNGDLVVDTDDLVIFSSRYLELDWETVDWCAFWEATAREDELYARAPEFYLKHFSKLLGFINIHFSCDLSDLNRDEVVNIDDLVIFSSNYLELGWDTVDWCAFYDATVSKQRFNSKFTHYYLEHFRLLLGIVYDTFACDGVPLLLTIKNQPKSLARITRNADTFSDYFGYYYISDARTGSVFIYDSNRILIGEMENLGKPLGVAIDSQGYLLVGNSNRNSIEVYDPANGDLLASFGEGLVRMPTAITVGSNGDIYVTDSKSHRVWVFEPSYVHVRTIGMPGRSDGQLKFPTDTATVIRDDGGAPVEEIFISDQGNHRIQVFDLHGNFLRTIGPPSVLSYYCIEYGMFCPKTIPRGTFNKLQALDVEYVGSVARLHVLDSYEAAVSILNPVSGALTASYGGYGRGAGLLRIPQDVLLTDGGGAIVTDDDSNEVEVFAIP